MLNRGKRRKEHDGEPIDSTPEADGSAADESTEHADQRAKPHKKLVVIEEYCTRIKGSGCDRCLHACPHGAIAFNESNAPTVDDSLCNGCGICYGVCDAFASTKLTMDDLHARIRRIATSGQRVYLTCRENVFPGLEVDTNVVVLPCLSMLSPEFWTLLLAENIRMSIACDLVYCDDCDRGGEIGGNLFPRAVEIAENRTGKKVLFAYRIPEKQKLIEKYTDGHDALGRRAAFTGLAADFGEIATGKRRLRNSEVLQDYYEKKERQRAVARLNLSDDNVLNKLVPHGRMKRTLFPKQKLILEAVERQPDIAPKIDVAVSVTDFDLCRKTYGCVAACPTGARCPDEETGIIQVDARLCIACGICVDACPNAACSLEEATAEAYIQALEEEDENSEA